MPLHCSFLPLFLSGGHSWLRGQGSLPALLLLCGGGDRTQVGRVVWPKGWHSAGRGCRAAGLAANPLSAGSKASSQGRCGCRVEPALERRPETPRGPPGLQPQGRARGEAAASGPPTRTAARSQRPHPPLPPGSDPPAQLTPGAKGPTRSAGSAASCRRPRARGGAERARGSRHVRAAPRPAPRLSWRGGASQGAPFRTGAGIGSPKRRGGEGRDAPKGPSGPERA